MFRISKCVNNHLIDRNKLFIWSVNMEIVDLKKYSTNKLLPVCKYGNVVFISEEVRQRTYPFNESGIIDYYLYHIDSKRINKIDRGKSKIWVDTFHRKEVEDEDAYYYITVKKQLFQNQYFLNRIDIDSGKSDNILEFNMDDEFNDMSFQVLDDDNIIVLFKKMHELNMEKFESFNYDMEQFGFDKGVLYNISSDKQFEIKDKDFLRGFRLIFFKTKIKNEECVVFEENYLDYFTKEDIYIDYHLNRISKKDKFYYKDCLKYSPLERFLTEIRQGKEKISFVDIEGRGIKGYEMYSGVDEDNIYYQVGDYGDEESEALVMLNKKDLSRKTIKLPKEYDNEEEIEVDNIVYICSLEDKYKAILQNKSLANEYIKVKEVIGGNGYYTYSNQLGLADEYIEYRYIITSRNHKETSVIDIKNNSIENFEREHKVFNNYLFLY